MPIREGDLVYIDYVGRVKETGEVFDTTIEEEAKKANIYREGQPYEPMLIAVGKSWAVRGLEEALIGREENEEIEVEVPPEKGFGERDPKKILLFTRRKLLESGIEEIPRPGSIITVNGLPAIVRAAGSGRVLLDFNPPLAGKTLIYKVYIRSICKSVEEKINALVRRRKRELAEKKKLYKYDEEKKTLEFYLDEKTALDKEITAVKRGIINDIFEFIPKIRKIRFIEEFVNPKRVRKKSSK